MLRLIINSNMKHITYCIALLIIGIVFIGCSKSKEEEQERTATITKETGTKDSINVKTEPEYPEYALLLNNEILCLDNHHMFSGEQLIGIKYIAIDTLTIEYLNTLQLCPSFRCFGEHKDFQKFREHIIKNCEAMEDMSYWEQYRIE